jgi:hypothetical protein
VAEFAGHSAGINVPDATRLYQHVRGVMEPNPQGAEDLSGNLYGDVAVAAPATVNQEQQRRFRSALATAAANAMATGQTNASQMMSGVKTGQETALSGEASATTDVPTANRLLAAASGKLREPFSGGVSPQGYTVNQESGEIFSQPELAAAARKALEAQAQQRTAAAGASNARAAGTGRARTVTPEQVTRWVNLDSNSEYKIQKAAWDALPSSKRKTVPEPALADIKKRMREEYSAGRRSVPANEKPPADYPDAQWDAARGVWYVTRNGQRMAIVED